MADNPVTETASAKIKLTFDVTDATFASEFVINAGNDHILVNFSSGYINDPASGATVLPIHSRVALSPAGAKRLCALLTHALGKTDTGQMPAGPGAQAAFPSLEASKTAN